MKNALFTLTKRLIDIILSLLFIIVFSPLYIVVAFAIWLQDKEWPFYVQERVGKDKKLFKLLKFRSMVANADQILFSNPELYKQMRSGANKVKDDPRITKIGKFIRKYSIDEFPQMINVIRGDMSIVGPRALRPDEFDNYAQQSPANAEKLGTLVTVKPGITGYWQVNGRSNVDFDRRMDLESYYAKNANLLLDIKIMLKTPFAIIKGEGAY
jgi:lipopolysaccharide/colanic/teichoic acid biosynthesis glycosyltransferase